MRVRGLLFTDFADAVLDAIANKMGSPAEIRAQAVRLRRKANITLGVRSDEDIAALICLIAG